MIGVAPTVNSYPVAPSQDLLEAIQGMQKNPGFYGCQQGNIKQINSLSMDLSASVHACPPGSAQDRSNRFLVVRDTPLEAATFTVLR